MLEGRLELGDVALQSGGVLRSAVLAYSTCGSLNAAGDNCVLIPSYFTGTHRSYAPLVGRDRALSPERHFLVFVNLFGNGLSTSPSHSSRPDETPNFPVVSIADNIVCQHRLLVSQLGVRRIRLATGWSMGAMQALWWAALYPGMVDAVLAVCGTASCWPLNQVFLSGVCAALRADTTFGLSTAGIPVRGLRAFARSYAGWAYSAEFFRDELYRSLGYASLEEVLERWEEDHLSWDAGDLLAMADTWRSADIARRGPGLDAIAARTVIMPCNTDAYFTLEECRIEAAAISDAKIEVLTSPYGHCAGAPGRFPMESAAIEAAMRNLLA